MATNGNGEVRKKLDLLEKVCLEDRERWKKSDERFAKNDERFNQILERMDRDRAETWARMDRDRAEAREEFEEVQADIRDMLKELVRLGRKSDRMEERLDAQMKILRRLMER